MSFLVLSSFRISEEMEIVPYAEAPWVFTMINDGCDITTSSSSFAEILLSLIVDLGGIGTSIGFGRHYKGYCCVFLVWYKAYAVLFAPRTQFGLNS
jgi:hypothetical protein